MSHSWDAYYKAQKIGESLMEAGLIKTWNLEKVRGIIQIILEEKPTEENEDS